MSSLAISIPVPNSVTIDNAKVAMLKLLPSLQTKFGAEVPITEIQTTWSNWDCTFSFKAKGNAITGNMQVGHNVVEIQANLPFFVSFFKGQITDAITEEATELLNAPTPA